MNRLFSFKKEKICFEDMIIVIKNKPEVSDLDGEKVMIDFTTGKYFVLKGVGNDIWDMLGSGVRVGYIVDKLVEEYQVTRDECMKTTRAFLKKLEECQFIEISE